MGEKVSTGLRGALVELLNQRIAFPPFYKDFYLSELRPDALETQVDRMLAHIPGLAASGKKITPHHILVNGHLTDLDSSQMDDFGQLETEYREATPPAEITIRELLGTIAHTRLHDKFITEASRREAKANHGNALALYLLSDPSLSHYYKFLDTVTHIVDTGELPENMSQADLKHTLERGIKLLDAQCREAQETATHWQHNPSSATGESFGSYMATAVTLHGGDAPKWLPGALAEKAKTSKKKPRAAALSALEREISARAKKHAPITADHYAAGHRMNIDFKADSHNEAALLQRIASSLDTLCNENGIPTSPWGDNERER